MRTRRVLPVAALAVAAVLAAGVVVRARSTPELTDGPLGHVHGLAVDPGDGALYAGAHTGLYRIEGPGRARRVADRWQDTMGLLAVGEGHFLASGHPDIRDRALQRPGTPPLLGLVETRDAGRTWRALSLLGEADLHALASAGGTVFAADATGERLLATSDRRQWDVRATGVSFSSLAVSPSDPSLLVAIHEGGAVRSTDGGRTWAPAGTPGAVLVGWDRVRGLWVAAGDGSVLAGDETASRWTRRGQLEGRPEALLVAADRLFVAIDGGTILRSTDGARWEVAYRAPPAAGGPGR